MAIKLLYITNGITGSGGLERVLSVKATKFADMNDYEVHILSLNEDGVKPFYQFSKNIIFHSVPYNGLLSYIRGLRKVVHAVNADIISVCDDGVKGFFVPIIVGKSCKMIYERHASINLNTNSSIKGRIIRKIMRLQAASFDRFIVLTKSNIEEWRTKNVIAIPNSLSSESKLASSLNNKKIIAVGSHSYNKGYDLLLSIWSRIEKKHPDWKLEIYGKIDCNETYIKLSKELHLQNVYFYKPVENIESKYLDASILVLTSRSEGFGMVLIEAMACGLPCISFDCPSGPRDIITNNEDGFLIPSENLDEYYNKLEQLIQDTNLRIKFGNKAQKNVQRFSLSNIIAEWDNLFKQLLSKQK